MNSTSDSPENTEKQEDSAAADASAGDRSSDESAGDRPVVIEGEAVEIAAIDEAEDESDETPENFPLSAPANRSSSIPIVIGGAIAAAIGFGAAYFLPNESGALTSAVEKANANAAELSSLSARVDEVTTSVPEPVDLSGIETNLSSMEAKITELSEANQGLSSDLSALRSELTTELTALKDVPPVDLSGISSDLKTLGDRISALEIEQGNSSSAQAAQAKEQLEAFTVELSELVSRTEGALDGAVSDALSEIQSAVSDAETRITTAEERAAEIEKASAAAQADAQRQAELSELKSAIEAGSSFEDEIGAFDNVPPELAASAKDGIPTLVILQSQFPDAARQALASSQTVPEDASTGERLAAFLRRQTNARSIAPRDGDDPDAILSRAEAALSNGDLSGAVAEVTTLPPAAQAAMEPWLENARIRQSALDAVDALSAQTN